MGLLTAARVLTREHRQPGSLPEPPESLSPNCPVQGPVTVGAVSHTRHPRGPAELGLWNVSSVQEEVSRVAGLSDVLQTPGNRERQPLPRPGQRLPSKWTQGFLRQVRSGSGSEGVTRAEEGTEKGGRGHNGA